MSIVVIAKSHYRGRTIALPHLGTVTIPADGRIEIADHVKAHAFVASLPKDISYENAKQDDPSFIEPTLEPLKQKSEDNGALDENTNAGGSQSIFEDLDDEEKAEYIAALPAMTRKQLEAMAQAFPGGEWRGKNKEQLVEYIKGKLTA